MTLVLANAGQSFDNIVAVHDAGEGWGKISQDNGLNLGKLTSEAHQSNQAASHNQSARGQSANNRTIQGAHTKSAARPRGTTRLGKARASSMKGIGHVGNGKSFRGTGHGVPSMSRGHGKR